MSQSPEAGEEVSRTEAAHSHARRFLPRPQFAARPRSGPRLGPPGGRSPPRRTAFYPAAFSGARGPLRSHGSLPQPLSPALGPRREGFRGPGGPGQGRSGTVVARPPAPPPPAPGRVGRDTQISESSAREGREGAERDAKIHQECGGQRQLHRVWRVPRDSEPRMWTERDLAHRECNMDGRRAVAGRRQRPVTSLGLFTKVKRRSCPLPAQPLDTSSGRGRRSKWVCWGWVWGARGSLHPLHAPAWRCSVSRSCVRFFPLSGRGGGLWSCGLQVESSACSLSARVLRCLLACFLFSSFFFCCCLFVWLFCFFSPVLFLLPRPAFWSLKL